VIRLRFGTRAGTGDDCRISTNGAGAVSTLGPACTVPGDVPGGSRALSALVGPGDDAPIAMDLPRYLIVPALTYNGGTAHPGDEVTVHGAGYHEGSGVTVLLDGAPISPHGTPTADDLGRVDVTITLPAGTSSSDHTITVTDQTLGRSASATVPVSDVSPT
jgi:hypothetical protein